MGGVLLCVFLRQAKTPGYALPSNRTARGSSLTRRSSYFGVLKMGGLERSVFCLASEGAQSDEENT